MIYFIWWSTYTAHFPTAAQSPKKRWHANRPAKPSEKAPVHLLTEHLK